MPPLIRGFFGARNTAPLDSDNPTGATSEAYSCDTWLVLSTKYPLLVIYLGGDFNKPPY